MPKRGVTKEKLSTTIDKDLFLKFSGHCEQEKKNKSAVVEELIQEYMEKEGKKK